MKDNPLKTVKEALKLNIEALEKTVVYSTGDGVWVNSRIKGSAMWGLQGDYENSEEIRESFAESARLNAAALKASKEALKAAEKVGDDEIWRLGWSEKMNQNFDKLMNKDK